jgi:hypothetical protein
MYVKIEFIVDTPEFGEVEFKREIEKLVADIDPIHTRLLAFQMNECEEPALTRRFYGAGNRGHYSGRE